MKKIIVMSSGLLVLFTSKLWAQQESVLAFYKTHLNLVNPAVVGVEEATVFTSTLRKQWTGIKDAPETQAVSFMTPLENNLSFGVSVIRDKVFIETQTYMSIDFSYKVKLNDDLDLFMGVKAGANNYEVNTSGLQTYNIASDPSLGNISRIHPNFGAGFYLKHKDYFVSLSTPKMLSSERAKNVEGYGTVTTDRTHIYLSGGYTYQINEEVTFSPSFMFRYVNGAPLSTDFTAAVNVSELADFALTYRTDNAIAGMTLFKVNNNFKLGYAYEYITSKDLLGRANGTHELVLRYQL